MPPGVEGIGAWLTDGFAGCPGNSHLGHKAPFKDDDGLTRIPFGRIFVEKGKEGRNEMFQFVSKKAILLTAGHIAASRIGWERKGKRPDGLAVE